MTGWIGVDFDGTLAEYTEWEGPSHVGAPIPAMVHRVREWLAEGYEVRIFTARVSHDNSTPRMRDARDAREAITAFCVEQFGTALQITNIKDYSMIELWDDRCVSVEPNTGRQIGVSRL